MHTLAARLKHYREAAGLTQGELAALINSSQSAIGNWESGTRKSPRASSLHAIAQALGIEPHILLGGSKPTVAHPKAELQLLAVYRSLSPQQQAVGVRLLKALRAK
jgi:transcriptional regulator with XRE-family HTH domain